MERGNENVLKIFHGTCLTMVRPSSTMCSHCDKNGESIKLTILIRFNHLDNVIKRDTYTTTVRRDKYEYMRENLIWVKIGRGRPQIYLAFFLPGNGYNSAACLLHRGNGKQHLLTRLFQLWEGNNYVLELFPPILRWRWPFWGKQFIAWPFHHCSLHRFRGRLAA